MADVTIEAGELQRRYAEERSARMRQRAAAMLKEELPDDGPAPGSIRERYQLSPAREVAKFRLRKVTNTPRLAAETCWKSRRGAQRGGEPIQQCSGEGRGGAEQTR